MAATNPVLLSSSPPRSVTATTPPHRSIVAMSSSPGLPSPSELLAKKVKPIASGGEAILTPKGAVGGLPSALSLLGQAHSRDRSGSPTNTKRTELGEKRSAQSCNKPPSNQTKSTVTDSGEADRVSKPKVTRKKAVAGRSGKESSDAVEGLEIQNGVAKSGPPIPKKVGAKKRKDEEQTTIRKSKITKPGATGKKDKAMKPSQAARAKKTKMVGEQSTTEWTAMEEPLSLCLKAAVQRRRDWTPIKDTAPDNQFAEHDGLAVVPDARPTVHGPVMEIESVTQDGLIGKFGSLLGKYGYAQLDDNSTATTNSFRNPDGEALTKRRKVELIKTVVIAQPLPKKGSKSPKRKPQTITEKATAPFIIETPSASSTLLEYFTVPGTEDTDDTGLTGTVSKDSLPPKSRQKKKVTKPKAATTKSKKAILKVPTLLSPESAMKTTKDQELVFGTCSQLALDESPTFIKNMRLAIDLSESTDEHINFSVARETERQGSLTTSKFNLCTMSRNLWSESTRSLDGSLLNAEVVNLVDSPEPQRGRTIEKIPPPTASEVPAVAPKVAGTEKERSTIENLLGPQGKALFALPAVLEEEVLDEEQSIPRSVAEAALRQRPKARSPAKVSKQINSLRERDASAHKSVPVVNPKTVVSLQERDASPTKSMPIKIPSHTIALQEEDASPSKPMPVKKPQNTTITQERDSTAPKSVPVKRPKKTTKLQEREAHPSQPLPPGMPNYQGFTTVELKKEIAAYGFKAIKNRDDMIALMEKCWESKNRVPLQNLPPNSNIPQPPATDTIMPELSRQSSPIKKGRRPKADATATVEITTTATNPDASSEMKRGRPRKEPTTTSPMKSKPNKALPPPVEEISDTESIPPTPSPPRRRSTSTSKPPPTLPLSPSHTTTTKITNKTSSSSNPTIQTSVTLAITSYPPTHNPTSLTYHEKILLYEPIVLEDLTKWLNETGLGLVGVDEEVGTAEVKTWCEARGVCCLWKKNLRGEERARW